MKPTDEQAAIINAATTTNDNLLITARAGAAKTTTLLMIAEAVPDTEAWFLAFSKDIADELGERLPSQCASDTFNRLGHHSWFNHLGMPRQRVDNFKVNKLLQYRVSRLVGSDRTEISEYWSEEILQAVKLGKNLGFLPRNLRGDWEPLRTEETFFPSLDFVPTPLQKELICDISSESFRQARQGKIDLDDQVFCPALCGINYETKPIVFVDEAQDLSPVQHQMLKDIVGNGRLIAVGDDCQAIYEFRGAMSDSMKQLQQRFNMREYKLTTSFRCDQAIVRNAQWRAPEMRWRDDAAEGQVATLETWGHGNIPDDAALLCRNNAPLFSIFIKLLSAGRNAELTNRVFINDLVKIMEKLRPATMPQSAALEAIREWRREAGERSNNTDFIDDQAECMRLFAMQADNLAGAVNFARNLTEQTGRIKLSTIHRSKGLQFDNVFILDRDLLQSVGQDRNLRYVAETRAKHNLTYITSLGYRESISSFDAAPSATLVHEPPETTVVPPVAASQPDQAAGRPSGAINRAVQRLRPRRRLRQSAPDADREPAASTRTTLPPQPGTSHLQLNDQVVHPDFGVGVILNIRMQRTIIDVIFDNAPRQMRSVPASELMPPPSAPGNVPDGSPIDDTTDTSVTPAPVATKPAPAAPPTPEAVELKVGDKVRHPGFGIGTIQSLNKSRYRVLFDNGLPPCEVRKSELEPVQ